MTNTFSPQDLKEIKNAFDEISNAMTRAEAEKDYIKEAFITLKDKFEIPPRLARKLAKVYHKRNVQEVVAENSDFEEFYDKVFPSK
jgi:Transcriptional regulator DsbA